MKKQKQIVLLLRTNLVLTMWSENPVGDRLVDPQCYDEMHAQ